MEVIHRIQCAAFANGCTGEITWSSGSEDIEARALQLLEMNGWRLDYGRWICGQHERKAD